MRNEQLVDFLTYFKNNMRERNVNYIEHIIISSDRNEVGIVNLGKMFNDAAVLLKKVDSLNNLSNSSKRKLAAVGKTDMSVLRPVDEALFQDKEIKKLKQNIPKLNSEIVEQLSRVLAYYSSLQKGIAPSISVIFRNGDIWNIENTSSLRSDRNIGLEARLSQFRSEKNYLIIDEFGKKGVRSNRPYTDPRNNVKVVSREEFVDDLMWQIYRYNTKKPWPTLIEEKNQKSVINSHRGNQWEKLLEKLLADEGFMGNIYDLIVSKLAEDENVQAEDIQIVDAKQMPGTNKSDFWIEYSVSGVLREKAGVSLKASGESMVTVHQTKAIDLISGLRITDKAVIRAINDFQACGSGKNLTTVQQNELKRYFSNSVNYRNFITWAFTRGGGVPVKYILLHSYACDSEYAIGHMRFEKIEDYMDMIKRKSTSSSRAKKGEASFGTGLSWTCPSKATEIQLKMPFIFE